MSFLKMSAQQLLKLQSFKKVKCTGDYYELVMENQTEKHY